MRIKMRTVALAGIVCLLLVTTVGAIPAGAVQSPPKERRQANSPFLFSPLSLQMAKLAT